MNGDSAVFIDNETPREFTALGAALEYAATRAAAFREVMIKGADGKRYVLILWDAAYSITISREV